MAVLGVEERVRVRGRANDAGRSVLAGRASVESAADIWEWAKTKSSSMERREDDEPRGGSRWKDECPSPFLGDDIAKGWLIDNDEEIEGSAAPK